MTASKIFEFKGHVHFVGICGIGMAGLAYMLVKHGFNVSGCDVCCNSLKHWLTDNGITVFEEHSPAHINENISFVVRTPAVSDSEPELISADLLHIPIFSRGEILAQLLDSYSDSISVCGTHGKTTTSTFIAQILLFSGKVPSWIIGGENSSLGSVAEEGSGKYIVAESDESDGTLELYKANYGIITNIEFDHMDYFDSRDDFVHCFAAFISRVQDKVIYCKDDSTCCKLLDDFDNSISFGFSSLSDYCIHSIENRSTEGTTFCLKTSSGDFPFFIPLLGTHNILNAAAAVVMTMELGITYDVIRSSLEKISLPKRRFETIFNRDNIRIVTDYAHHPTELKAMLQTAKLHNHKKCRVLFQPHRYTRTKTLGAEFPAVFAGVDELILLPVYSASESIIEGGTVFDLYQNFLEAGKINCAIPKPILSLSIEEVTEFYRTTLAPGDILLIAGAGTVHRVATSIESLGLKKHIFIPENMSKYMFDNVNVGKKTTFGCGGNADFFAKISSEEQLTQVYDFALKNNLKIKFIGGGSNVLVSDLGFRGIICRFSDDYNKIYADGKHIAAGAGATNSGVLKYMHGNRLGGLEFLSGIPGTIGGAVITNAGAFGSEIFDYIQEIELYDGKIVTLTRDKMTPGYRKTPEVLNNKIITKVVIKVKDLSDKDIQLQKSYRDKRQWQKQYRTAGSTFKNPDKDIYAWKLIQDVFKTPINIGGAFIASEHFNFICADKTASSSDIIALINHIKFAVEKKYNIILETEIILL
jgi:UDP-N-acetylmuramate--alanine ligase